MKKLDITKIVKGSGIEAVRLFALYLAKLDGKNLCFADKEFEKYYFRSAEMYLEACQQKVCALGFNLQPFWLTALTVTVSSLLGLIVLGASLWACAIISAVLGGLTYFALFAQTAQTKKKAVSNLLTAQNLLLNLNRKA